MIVIRDNSALSALAEANLLSLLPRLFGVVIIPEAVRRECGHRAMTEEQRILSGPRLFAGVCDRISEGLRDENPNASPEALHRLLRHRLSIVLEPRRRSVP